MKVALTGYIKEKELVVEDGQDCFLKIYLHKTQKTNKTIFIIPGGAYGGICVRENELTKIDDKGNVKNVV